MLALIAALAVLIWFSMLSEFADSYDSLSTHGIYGSYQREMFGLYGETLEPEELTDYDIPGKKAAIHAEMDALIAGDSLFAKHGIRNAEEYQAFADRDTEGLGEEKRMEFFETVNQMISRLSLSDDKQTLDEWYTSPQIRLQTLEALEQTYADYESFLQIYIDRDERPVVVQAARQILEQRNDSLIRHDLSSSVSLYAAVVGVFSIASTLLLTAVPLSRDRMQNMHQVHYSSRIGRRILKIQAAAMCVSGCALSLLLIALSAVPLLAAGVGDYGNVSILSFTLTDMVLYEITFGPYTLFLAGMIVLLSIAAACFAFVLARFSSNLMTMLIKLVPVGIALSGLAVLVLYMTFSYHNLLFSAVLRGRIPMPEPMLCAIVAAAGVLAAVIVLIREKKTDTD